ncbi:7-cyano-7-deazaguanine synthase QueC [Nitrosovibrio sp. Nv4]|uniref:7-cyano-7-deazaguanine synthase QueC n=1 Tax=Nitrosovibrio sp. Nv4 TaxID=1945880 RepID=UPI000BC7F949|nr:7-cyano-7-deazaguanine synthase QueC [Nitrosovibrio sp. Nv4]SOD40332.1 preQ(0) biosynthesis protein QueC [Nitrosovibrio sp. Nv4]
MAKAVVLLSGGLDSATTLAIARSRKYECYALSIDYGQRHGSELAAAEKLAHSLGARDHKVIKVDLSAFGGSALTDKSSAIPTEGTEAGIPVTYVPARNTIMLSLALAWAEVLESRDIFIGANVVDYSGYPDCRPEYLAAFERMANLATKAAIEGARLSIHAPLMKLSKAQIIQQGALLGLDYSLTVSCYQADEEGLACGVCDSCRLRRAGFESANIADVTRYQS